MNENTRDALIVCTAIVCATALVVTGNGGALVLLGLIGFALWMAAS